MASLWVDVRDIKFQLFEVLKIQETLLGKGRYVDYDLDTCNMVLDQAAKFSELELAPTYPDEVHRNRSRQHGKMEKSPHLMPIKDYGNFIVKPVIWPRVTIRK